MPDRVVDFGELTQDPNVVSDWEEFWFDLGFYDRWNQAGPFFQNSRLSTQGPWLTQTVGSLDWDTVAYEPIRYGQTYDGGLFDGEQMLTTTCHLRGALGCTVRLGFSSWPDFGNQQYEEVGPWGDNDEHVMRYQGFAPGSQPATPFISCISDGVIRDGLYDGLAFQVSQWHTSGPEFIPNVGPPPRPPKQPPGKVYPGAQSLGHFPLRAR